MNNYFYYQKQNYSVGISTHSFNNIYAYQKNSMWCWAACIQMILKHHNINVSQEELANLTCGIDLYGVPNNCPASFDVITDHLNVCWQTDWEDYCVKTHLKYGAPKVGELYNQLSQNKPVIIVYRNPSSLIGHAVLITGMEGYFLKDKIVTNKIILRDPWPSYSNIANLGRIEKNRTLSFIENVLAHWFVTVEPIRNDVFWNDIVVGYSIV